MNTHVTVYRTSWCGWCRHLEAALNDIGVPFEAIDIERTPDAAAVVSAANNGNLTVPTVLFPDGRTMTNPSAEEVVARLAS